MKDNIGLVLGLLGILLIALGFIIGAFMLHWIFGLIVSGLAFIVLAGFVLSIGEDDF